MSYTNPCLRVLSEFNKKEHYLSISEDDQPILRKKADLSWLSRIVRWFWKPSNERISFVANKVFANLGDDIFGQLNHKPEALKHVIKQLDDLADKTKQNKATLKAKLSELHIENFGALGVHNTDESFKTKITECQNTIQNLQHQIITTSERLAPLAKEKQALESNIQDKRKELDEMILAKTNELNVVIQEKKRNIINLDGATSVVKADLEILKGEVERLTFDTILLAEDGYVLCNSAFFGKDSMVNTESMMHMTFNSSKEQKKLGELTKLNPELFQKLDELPKSVYLENSKIKHVKMLVALQEMGPGALTDCTMQDYQDVTVIANFLMQELPEVKICQLKEEMQRLKFKTDQEQTRLQDAMYHQTAELNSEKKRVADLDGRLQAQTKQVNAYAEEASRLRGQLNQEVANYNILNTQYQAKTAEADEKDKQLKTIQTQKSEKKGLKAAAKTVAVETAKVVATKTSEAVIGKTATTIVSTAAKIVKKAAKK